MMFGFEWVIWRERRIWTVLCSLDIVGPRLGEFGGRPILGCLG